MTRIEQDTHALTAAGLLRLAFDRSWLTIALVAGLVAVRQAVTRVLHVRTGARR